MSTREEQLAAAIEALTAAGRGLAGGVDELGGRQRADWAEFVTLALAGAAANLGGVELALSGRPGSWEADGVRQLLFSTVGYDEGDLLRHRTEPLLVELYVEELLEDALASYDAAFEVLDAKVGVLADAGAPDAEVEAAELAAGRVDEQRLADWRAYGEALAAKVREVAGVLPGLTVPVVVKVDLTTWRPHDQRPSEWGAASRVLDEAIEAVPAPAARP